MKKKFLAVHDYGQGGSWIFMLARSADEIVSKYPEFKVIDTPPAWMTDDELKKIEKNHLYDIDAPPSGWLATLLRETRRS